MARRANNFTVPGRQIRDLSLRSTSVHMVSSTSSFSELYSARMRSASSMALSPRRAVPDMGELSTLSPSTRTNISGEAPINCSPENWKKNS